MIGRCLVGGKWGVNRGGGRLSIFPDLQKNKTIHGIDSRW